MKKSPVITAAVLSAEGVAAAIMIFCGKYAFNEDSLYFVLTAFLVVPYVSAAASFVAFVYRSRFYAVIPFFSLTLFAFLPLAVLLPPVMICWSRSTSAVLRSSSSLSRHPV